ncbi:MAG: hypothetical protein V3U65_06650 [Granulosicoccaceae bacterium]
MKLRVMVAAAVILLFCTKASALTMNQFVEICDSSETRCRDQPLLQIYVGGALDLITVLDEETDYLSTMYCESPEKLFKVPQIIDYMLTHKESYADRNAMLLVVKYLEENSGC